MTRDEALKQIASDPPDDLGHYMQRVSELVAENERLTAALRCALEICPSAQWGNGRCEDCDGEHSHAPGCIVGEALK